MATDRAPLPCGWRPDPARIALRRMDQAGARYAAEVQAANGDADLIAIAERAFVAELDAIERWADEQAP